jgi:hypothetical protein
MILSFSQAVINVWKSISSGVANFVIAPWWVFSFRFQICLLKLDQYLIVGLLPLF